MYEQEGEERREGAGVKGGGLKEGRSGGRGVEFCNRAEFYNKLNFQPGKFSDFSVLISKSSRSFLSTVTSY